MKGLGIGFFLLFFGIVGLDLWVGGTESLREWRIYTKPLILLSLITYFTIKSAREVPGLLRVGVLLALVFSLFGDIFLIFSQQDEKYFLLGLVSFLLAHVTYIVIFLTQRDQLSLRAWRWALIILLLFHLFGFLSLLWPHIGKMHIPVSLYAAVICTMAIAATIRKKELGRGYVLVLVGAILFVISDSALAYNKFYQSFDASHYVVMITYAAAQYMIVKGILRYSLIK